MYTNLQQNDRETPGYPNKNRENGYRSPYDPEREWNGYRFVLFANFFVRQFFRTK